MENNFKRDFALISLISKNEYEKSIITIDEFDENKNELFYTFKQNFLELDNKEELRKLNFKISGYITSFSTVNCYSGKTFTYFLNLTKGYKQIIFNTDSLSLSTDNVLDKGYIKNLTNSDLVLDCGTNGLFEFPKGYTVVIQNNIHTKQYEILEMYSGKRQAKFIKYDENKKDRIEGFTKNFVDFGEEQNQNTIEGNNRRIQRKYEEQDEGFFGFIAGLIRKIKPSIININIFEGFDEYISKNIDFSNEFSKDYLRNSEVGNYYTSTNSQKYKIEFVEERYSIINTWTNEIISKNLKFKGTTEILNKHLHSYIGNDPVTYLRDKGL